MRGRLRAAAVMLAVALTAGTAPAGAAVVPGTASLQASTGIVTHGEAVALSGVLQTSAACTQARSVRVQRRPSPSPTWEEAGVTTTAAEGGFLLEIVPDAIAAYRVVVEAETRGSDLCEEAISPEVPLQVRAAVWLRVPERVRASRCAPAIVTVGPPKPGQMVELQRRTAGSWQTVAQGELDAESTASLPLCTEWRDLGAVKVRGHWGAQDELTLSGAGVEISTQVVKARWMRRIDSLTAGLPIGVSVRDGGSFIYRRADRVARVPASNQKLLLSMALMEAMGADASLPTIAAATKREGGIIRGDLWILGRGDPSIGRGDLRRLARRIKQAGIRKVRGSVRGSTAYFARDWWAPGWRRYFPGAIVALPTALTYEGNRDRPPERRAAKELTRLLRKQGVRVRGRPGTGPGPGEAAEIARVERPLSRLLGAMNHGSVNFFAEVLVKRLGVATSGPPGTIAKGASAIAAWAKARGVGLRSFDGSGLSYANRATPAGVARLLEAAEASSWGEVLRSSLPSGGEGTLKNRLRGLPVQAKTGTLTSISALSGWVLAKRTGSWVEFSVLATGMSTLRAKRIEDKIVKTLRRGAA